MPGNRVVVVVIVVVVVVTEGTVGAAHVAALPRMGCRWCEP